MDGATAIPITGKPTIRGHVALLQGGVHLDLYLGSRSGLT